ncbi:MAG: LysR family transcriptional regulator [Methylocella sp.]
MALRNSSPSPGWVASRWRPRNWASPKSAVGRAVSRLETRLGANLLHRTTRRLTLTSDGETWLEHCIAALAELDRGEGVLSSGRHEPSGPTRIDLPSAFGRLLKKSA